MKKTKEVPTELENFICGAFKYSPEGLLQTVGDCGSSSRNFSDLHSFYKH